uniref:LicD/FKTN/FKRP nucleotidyltransferase domain-containing protein n=1 Tax=Meloidogyne incognita TaxID=6306 RepID=A0A914L6U2_MELIC
MPSDWKAFKRDWKKGKYLECTPLLERPKNTSRKIPIKFLDRLVEFSNLLDKHNATAFLMGGTLLGWARECSLIPHTTDTDLGMFSEEHSDLVQLEEQDSDYGKEEWKKDFPTKNFVWDLSHKNVEAMEFYTELEWPNVYIYVTNKTERFDSKKVDEWIKNINKTL